MTKQKNTITPVEDVFAGLKFVDNMYEAAKKANMPASLQESFEDKLKQKLTEGEHKMDENRYTDQNNEYPNYNYEAAPVDDVPVEEPVAPAAEPAMGADMAGGEMGADLGGDMGMGGADMGGDMGMGDSGMGGDMGAEAGALPTEDIPGGEAPQAEQPEDISALVDELIDADIEEAAQETGMMGIEEVVAEMKKGDDDDEDKAPMFEMKDEKMYEMHEGAYHEMAKDDYAEKGEDLYEVKGEMYEMKDGAMYEAKKADDDDKKDGKNPFAKKDDDKKDDVKEGVEYKDAGTETPKSNVASASKIDQSKSQGKASSANLGAKYVDLGDDDHKSKVQQGVTRENTDKQDVGSNVATAAKVDQSKEQGNPDSASLGGDYKSAGSDADKAWSSVKKESKLKSKALYKLAEKYLSLEDKHKDVQIEGYKAVKAAGVLALAPADLTVETREQLVKKFDECASKSQIDKLYNTAVQLMKEHSKKDISQIVGKDTSIKHSLKEGAKDAAPKQVLTEDQKRILFLSGQGHEDQYNNW